MDLLADVMATRDLLLGAFGGAFVIGFAYMIFLRWFAKPIVYGSILFIIAGVGGGGYMLYQIAGTLVETD